MGVVEFAIQSVYLQKLNFPSFVVATVDDGFGTTAYSRMAFCRMTVSKQNDIRQNSAVALK
jgi:hypothetical protein